MHEHLCLLELVGDMTCMSREFTINLISNWFVEAANFTSGSFDAGVDEVEMSGLTPMPSVKVCHFRR